MATKEQIQSVIDLHENNNTTLTGWDQTIGQYAYDRNNPYILAEAKKKILDFPSSSGTVYKLINNYPTETYTVLINGENAGDILYAPWDSGVLPELKGDYLFEFDNHGGNGTGIVSIRHATLIDYDPVMSETQWDFSEMLLLYEGNYNDVGLFGNDWETEVFYAQWDINGVMSPLQTSYGFTIDEPTLVITGENF